MVNAWAGNRVRRRESHLALFVLFVVIVTIRSAAAGDIPLSGGSLDLNGGAFSSGPLSLTGERGFTLRAGFLAGVAPAWNCIAKPCLPGEAVDLLARARGTDLFSTGTLDGFSFQSDSVVVQFTGSVVLPPFGLGSEQTVSAPFRVTGQLSIATPSTPAIETLYGNGTATVFLEVDHSFGPDHWQIRRVVYELSPPVPSPWVSADIGGVSRRGIATDTDGDLLVSGDGSDIWGSADSFHFVYQEIDASAITARVNYQSGFHWYTEGSSATLDRLAKAGIMMRASAEPGAPSVILDLKPDGELEFMVRYAADEPTLYLGGALAAGPRVFLKLVRQVGNVVTGYQSTNGGDWQLVGTTSIQLPDSRVLAGLAVTSHDPGTLNIASFDSVEIVALANLLTQGDFEGYKPPALGSPGWISDHLFRQVPAKSEYHQPRSGAKNGACWTTEYLDCGIYQEVTAPVSGTYTLRMYASADRAGGLVGVDVNGRLAASMNVEAAPFGVYSEYVMTFTATAGEVIHVWMYSPAWPGYVVIDDASLSAPAAASATPLE